MLIGGSGPRLLPPVCAPSTAALARRSFLAKYGFSVGIWLMAACFVLLVGGERQRTIGYVALGLAVYFVFDFFVLRAKAGLEERARFVYWVRHSGITRSAFVWSVIFSLAIGVGQWLLIRKTGSSLELIQSWGLVFQDARNGETWRYLSGAYLHADLNHYLANIFLFIPTFSLAWLLLGRHALFAFILGNLFSSLFSSLQIFGDFDAYAGISGGIFALLGLIFARVLFDRLKFPRCLWVNVALVSALTLFASSLLNGRSLLTTHAAGFFVGLIYYLAIERAARSRIGD